MALRCERWSWPEGVPGMGISQVTSSKHIHSSKRIASGQIVLYLVKVNLQHFSCTLWQNTKSTRQKTTQNQNIVSKGREHETQKKKPKGQISKPKTRNIKVCQNIAEASRFPSNSWQLSKDDVADAPPMYKMVMACTGLQVV